MYNGKKVTAIIVSAGSGKRFGGDVPKQFVKTGGVTVLEKATAAFENCPLIDRILIVTNQDFVLLTEKLVSGFSKVEFPLIIGGKERQDSVNNALEKTGEEIVLIHDAARPFVTREVIENVVKEAYSSGAALPGVTPKDTIRTEKETLKRSELYQVQTPQGFDAAILRDAYKSAYDDGYYGTDDAGLVERTGRKVSIVQGDYGNIKITTSDDLPPSDREDRKMDIRVGTGFDVHKLVEGRKCILCGVDIPYEKGLLGHSDADVALHAAMDAILGAAGLGDIGRHFPDTDERYRGISSMKLLSEVNSLIKDEGYTVGNIDITIICERPKISPHIEEMRKNVADMLETDISRVNIKGTTTEKLGFTGRGEGIASEAVCLLNKE